MWYDNVSYLALLTLWQLISRLLHEHQTSVSFVCTLLEFWIGSWKKGRTFYDFFVGEWKYIYNLSLEGGFNWDQFAPGLLKSNELILDLVRIHALTPSAKRHAPLKCWFYFYHELRPYLISWRRQGFSRLVNKTSYMCMGKKGFFSEKLKIFLILHTLGKNKNKV